MTKVLYESRTISEALAGRPFTGEIKTFSFGLIAMLYIMCIEVFGPGRDYSKARVVSTERGERKGERMVIHKRAIMGQDSFTYGDYRQYLVKRDDGATQPVRYSRIPAILMFLGACGLFLPATALMMILGGAPYESIAVDRVYIFTAVSLTLLVIALALTFGPYRLLTTVGPRCYDGIRRFYFEIEEAEEKRLIEEDRQRLSDEPVL